MVETESNQHSNQTDIIDWWFRISANVVWLNNLHLEKNVRLLQILQSLWNTEIFLSRDVFIVVLLSIVWFTIKVMKHQRVYKFQVLVSFDSQVLLRWSPLTLLLNVYGHEDWSKSRVVRLIWWCQSNIQIWTFYDCEQKEHQYLKMFEFGNVFTFTNDCYLPMLFSILSFKWIC